ncbi:MAG: hypothetical protein LC646_04475 [Xanthomonadaceae bacterium]|nr:hypothetical protein [Xanthomonadaceae bacterium]
MTSEPHAFMGLAFSAILKSMERNRNRMTTSFQFAKHIALPITIILICWLLYMPGLSGDFLFDDHPSILNNKATALESLGTDELKQVFASGTAGPLKRPIAMMSFALNHYATGYDSYWFKATNLIIHCINGMGVFILSYLLLNAYRTHQENRLSREYIYLLSAAISLVWLIHPINLTSVLYVVQRMNSLAAMFSLLGLILYAVGRMHQLKGEAGTIWICLGLFIATPLAVLSKENGILLPAFITVLEIVFFRFRGVRGNNKRILIGLHAAIVLIPILLLSYLLIASPASILGGYQARDFTLLERLLTQTRVIWFYISQIFLPVNAKMGIYHDDMAISSDLFSPASTFAAVLGLLALVATALFSLKRAPILAFGIIFFLVGHSLESTILPLELVHEHRNYLPSFGLLFALLFYISYPLALKDSARLRQIGACFMIATFALVTFTRSYIWSDPVTHITFETENHPDSPRANQEIGQLYMRMGLSDSANGPIYLSAARHHFRKSSQLSENFLGGLFASLALESSLENEIPQDLLDDLLERLQHQPFSSNTVNWIEYLVKCIASGDCDINGNAMHEIIQAALANPTVTGRTKAELYTASSNFYFHANDYESTLYLSAEAAGMLPNNVRYRLNLVNILIILNRLDDASDELNAAMVQDRFGAHNHEIMRLASILDDLALAKRSNPSH